MAQTTYSFVPLHSSENSLCPQNHGAQAEGRKYGSGDFGPGGAGMGQHDMVMRRSTDSGRSFARLATLVDAVDFAPWKGQSPETANDRGNAV